jgi:TonB family protein
MRWARRAGGALLVSTFAHAMAAAAVGVVVRSMTRDRAAEPGVVDVDLAPSADSPAENSPPTREPFHRAGAEPAPKPFAAKRRTVTSLTHATAGVTGPSIVSAPTAADEPVRFALSVGTVATRAGASSDAAALSPRIAPEGDAEAIGERDVNVPARLLSSSPLVYPPLARQAEIELDFPVEIVVDANGRVAAARAVSRVGYGLDEAALRAIREYRFSPALRAGRPVRVRMRWTVQFRLR